MRDSRLNLRLESKMLNEMKKYAKRNRTTVSALVDQYFRELLAKERTVIIAVTTGEAEQV